jgi:hypothetical protein
MQLDQSVAVRNQPGVAQFPEAAVEVHRSHARDVRQFLLVERQAVTGISRLADELQPGMHFAEELSDPGAAALLA